MRAVSASALLPVIQNAAGSLRGAMLPQPL